MFIFLVILIVIVAILLTIVVLLQSGKGGGLAGIASGGQTTQILGARQAPDFLEKATWTLGVALLALCFVAPFMTVGDGAANGSILQDRADELPATAPGVPPATGDAVPLEAPAGDGATTTPEAPQTTPVSPGTPADAPAATE